MKLIIGLGNPGKEYENNRHNVGYMFADFSTDKGDFKVFKTEKIFMNDSGRFVAEKVNFFKISPSDLVVVHDDLDLRFGEFKINFGKGPQIHNGILSIENILGTKDFWRVRIGIDNRVVGEGKLGDSGHDYVLSNFTYDEIKQLNSLFPLVYEELRKRVV